MNKKHLLAAGFSGVFALCLPACKGEATKSASSTATDPTTVVSWAAPVAVTASGGGASPSFALSPGGKISLAWISATDGGGDGKLNVQTDARAALAATAVDSASRNVSTFKDPLSDLRIHGEAPPKLAYRDDSTLYAAYLVTKLVRNNKPQNALRFLSSSDGGKTWGTPVTVTPDTVFGQYDDQSLLIGSNGSLYLSWISEGAKDTAHVYLANSTDAGKTWSKPHAVDTDASCQCCKTSLATGADGSLYLAWRKRFAGEVRDIVVARSMDQGATWSKPVRVYADEWQVNYCTDAGPTLKISKNGTVHVAWYTGKLGRAGTQYAQSTDGAKTFSKPTELGLAANSRPSHVQLVLSQDTDEQTIVALWDDGTMTVPQIVMRVSHDAGKTFATSQAVSAPGVQATFPKGVLRRDTLRIVWQERTLAGVTADSLVRDKKRDKDKPEADINVVGTHQIMMRTGVLQRPKK